MSTARLHSAPAGRLFKSEQLDGKRVARGFITLEERDEHGEMVRDYDGDFVIASGGVCKSVPVVNWDHGIVIGWGAKPVLKAVDDNGQLISGLVGTSYLATTASDLANVDLSRRNHKGEVVGRWAVKDCLDAAEDLWPIIRDQIATGLSMEFSGLPNGMERGRKSHVSGRPQTIYHAYEIHGWAHTPRPINRMAHLFEPEEQAEKAFRDLAERGKSQLVRKSMTALLANLPKGATVVPVTPIKRKSMEPLVDDAPVDAAPVDAPPETPPEDAGPPEATNAYDAAQMFSDFAEQFKGVVSKTLHGKSRKFFTKLADTLEKLAADCVAHGEGVEGELAGASPDEEEEDSDPDADDGADDQDDDSDPTQKSFAPLEKDASGSLILKSSYRPRRARQYKASELRDPIPDGSVTYTKDEHDALMLGIDELKKLLPKTRTP